MVSGLGGISCRVTIEAPGMQLECHPSGWRGPRVTQGPAAAHGTLGMRRSEFTDSEIIDLLREADAGTPIAQICRTAEVSPRTFYRWRQRFGGLEPGGLAELRALQMENRRLRAVLEDLVHAPA